MTQTSLKLPSEWTSGVRFFGLDFMEFVHDHARLKIPDLAEIDEDNSSFAYWDATLNGQTIYFNYGLFRPKGYPKGYKFTCSYMDRPVDCFALLYGGQSGATTSRDKLVLYSGFFVLLYNGYFNFTATEFLKAFFEIQPGSITRIDIALDLEIKLPVILKYFDKGTKFHSTIGDDEKHRGFFQTYYTSQIQNSLNRTRQVRIYDKVLDSFKKQKSFLFPHLKGCKEMRRVEVELREQWCKRIKEHPYLILDQTAGIVPRYFQENISKFSTAFGSLKLDLLPYQKYESTLREDFLESGQIPESYHTRVQGYLKNVIENTGYQGLFQIIFDSIISLEESKKSQVIRQKADRDPQKVLVELVYFMHKKLGVPGWKIWRSFETFKSIRNDKPFISSAQAKVLFTKKAP